MFEKIFGGNKKETKNQKPIPVDSSESNVSKMPDDIEDRAKLAIERKKIKDEEKELERQKRELIINAKPQEITDRPSNESNVETDIDFPELMGQDRSARGKLENYYNKNRENPESSN